MRRALSGGPLDDIAEYEASPTSLEIGQPLASEFAPAVVEYLGAAGFQQERSILVRGEKVYSHSSMPLTHLSKPLLDTVDGNDGNELL